MFTIQRIKRGTWLVHFETINKRYTKEFTSEKKCKEYINKNNKL